MAGIELIDVYKSYHVSGRPLPVLRGVTLSLPAEGITVVAGRSGCGKTTLLRTLGGLEHLDKGEIRFPVNCKIGMVFQEPRLMPWLTVWKNITFGQHGPNEEHIHALIRTVGLTGFEFAYPDQLSGGMQQRVALARVLAYNADYILMDEPFASLDYFTRETMQQELIRINAAEQKGIVFVTHSIDEALLVGSQIVVLDDGVIKSIYDLNEFTYERDLLTPTFISLKRRILEDLNESMHTKGENL